MIIVDRAPVSVVMCAFNAEATIDAALASIAGQIVMPAEVVVVDDGSTDGTRRQIEAWKGHLPLVLVVNEQNEGPAAARNRAVAQASQPIIAIIDADDLVLPNHFSMLYEEHRTHGGLIAPRMARWDPDAATTLLPSDLPLPPPRTEQRIEILKVNFCGGWFMVDRQSFLEIGGMRAEAGHEDWDIVIRLVHAGVPVSSPKQVTYLYRLSRGGLMRSPGAAARAVATIDRALELDLSDEERRVTLRTARRLRSNTALAESYELARRGEHLRARSAAAQALRGGLPIKLRATAMMIAPARISERRDRR
jgi:glycosyltransferase involved in cell wall biosynthesis